MSEPARGGPRRRLRLLRRRKDRRYAAAMTVVEHLGELRSRIMKSLVAFVVIASVVFAFYTPIEEFLRGPLCDLPADMLGRQGCKLIITKPLEGFQFRIKLTTLVALAVTSPVWLYQVWAFIVPALTDKERKYSLPFLFSSIALFLVGTAFAYLTLPTGLRFLIELAGSHIDPLLTAESYLNFVALMLLAFGLTFELPLLLFFLGLADIVTVEQLKRQRKAALVSIFVVAAVVTPSQDPFTMSVMGIALYGLYEVTILILSRVLKKKREPQLV